MRQILAKWLIFCVVGWLLPRDICGMMGWVMLCNDFVLCIGYVMSFFDMYIWPRLCFYSSVALYNKRSGSLTCLKPGNTGFVGNRGC